MNNHARIALWTKDFNLLFLTNFFMSIGGQILVPILPLFAMHALGATQAQIGSLIAVYSFAALIIRPFSGYSYDNLGRKATYLTALVFFTLIALGHMVIATFFMLIIFRVLHGFAFGVASTGGPTITADLLHPKRRAEGIGYFSLSMTLAMALGPALGIHILGDGRFSAVFMVTAVLMALAFLTANFISFPQIASSRAKVSLQSLFETRILSLAFLTMMATILMGGIFSFVVIYGEQLGLANPGIFFFINSLGVVITRIFAGRIHDRYGPQPILLFAFIMQMIGFIILSQSSGLLSFSLSAFIIGLGNGSAGPSMQAMIFNMVVAQRRGAANSTHFAAIDIGIGAGSLLLGWLADLTSLSTMFLICGLFLMVPLLFFQFYAMKDYEKKSEEIRQIEEIATLHLYEKSK